MQAEDKLGRLETMVAQLLQVTTKVEEIQKNQGPREPSIERSNASQFELMQRMGNRPRRESAGVVPPAPPVLTPEQKLHESIVQLPLATTAELAAAVGIEEPAANRALAKLANEDRVAKCVSWSGETRWVLRATKDMEPSDRQRAIVQILQVMPSTKADLMTIYGSTDKDLDNDLTAIKRNYDVTIVDKQGRALRYYIMPQHATPISTISKKRRRTSPKSR